jgi:hypothetical protein
MTNRKERALRHKFVALALSRADEANKAANMSPGILWKNAFSSEIDEELSPLLFKNGWFEAWKRSTRCFSVSWWTTGHSIRQRMSRLLPPVE